MVAAITIILMLLILCATILIAYHMNLCDENGVGWYADPKYEERISRLEKIIKEKEEENK